MKKSLFSALAFALAACLCASGIAAVRPDSVFVSTFDAETEAIQPEAAEPFAEQTLAEQTLAGYIIGIDPGHQQHQNSAQEPISPDSKKTKPKVSSGTSGSYTKVPEYAVNLQISLLLRDALEKKGATVVMTHDTADVDISNIERAQMINDANADICLRLHCNGSTDHSAHGTQMFVRKSGDKAEESAEAAKIIIDSMCEKTGARNRGVVKNNDYTGLNWSTVPSILVEMGFMSNKTEDEALSSPEYQQKLVDGMVEGLEKYFAGVK